MEPKTLSLRQTLEITKMIFEQSFHVPVELEGLVVNSLKELQEKCPPNRRRGEVYLQEHMESKDGGKGMDVYAMPKKRGSWDNVAYGCPGCKNIYAGPPEIKIIENKGAILYLCKCGMPLLNLKPEPLEF